VHSKTMVVAPFGCVGNVRRQEGHHHRRGASAARS
jgi:hypothetical protein